MFFRKISVLAISAMLAAGAVGAIAQEAFTPPTSAAEAIQMREDLMKENGAVLRTAAGLSGAEAVAAAQTLLDNYTQLPELFAEGFEGGDALPAIWQNWETFTAIAETGRSAAEAALTAAEAGDAAAYGAALQTLQGTCGQCHQQFRS